MDSRHIARPNPALALLTCMVALAYALDEHKTAPFELGPKPEAAKGTVLLIHGFTGSPWEVRPLGEALGNAGYYVKGIRLPGHGTTPEAMLNVSAQDWEQAAEDALFELSGSSPVHMAGLSMGALLSVQCAARHPERVRSLTLMAPAMEFLGPTMQLVRWASAFPFLERLKPWVEKESTDIMDPLAREDSPVLHRFPLARVWDLYRTQDGAREVMHDVRAPALIVCAENDHVVSVEGGRELARAFKGDVRLLRLARGSHIIPRDLDKELLFREVTEFLRTRSR